MNVVLGCVTILLITEINNLFPMKTYRFYNTFNLSGKTLFCFTFCFQLFLKILFTMIFKNSLILLFMASQYIYNTWDLHIHIRLYYMAQATFKIIKVH